MIIVGKRVIAMGYWGMSPSLHLAARGDNGHVIHIVGVYMNRSSELELAGSGFGREAVKRAGETIRSAAEVVQH